MTANNWGKKQTNLAFLEYKYILVSMYNANNKTKGPGGNTTFHRHNHI